MIIRSIQHSFCSTVTGRTAIGIISHTSNTGSLTGQTYICCRYEYIASEAIAGKGGTECSIKVRFAGEASRAVAAGYA